MAISRKIYTNSDVEILAMDADLSGGSDTGVKLYAKPDTVQNATFTLTIPRADVNAFGVKGVVARPVLEAHSANIEFSFIPRDASGDASSSQLEDGTQTPAEHANTGNLSELDLNAMMQDTLANEPKYVAVQVQEIGALTNALMSSFSADASVGAMPTFSLSFIGAEGAWGAGTGAGSSEVAGTGNTATLIDVVEPQDITVGTGDYPGTNGCVQSLAWAWDIPVELVLCLGGDPATQGEALSSPPGTASKTIEGLGEVADGSVLRVSNIGAYQFNIGSAANVDSRTHNMAVGELFATYNYVMGSTADTCTIA